LQRGTGYYVGIAVLDPLQDSMIESIIESCTVEHGLKALKAMHGYVTPGFSSVRDVRVYVITDQSQVRSCSVKVHIIAICHRSSATGTYESTDGIVVAWTVEGAVFNGCMLHALLPTKNILVD
jgi:hypothetical protein